MTADDEPFVLRCATIHSHGGGVGRTSLVANLSRELAAVHGLDVLALDWDLDAPGLQDWFGDIRSDLAGRPGLVEYLAASRRELSRVGPVAPGIETSGGPSLDDHLTDLREAAHGTGRLCLMTAGVLDEGYRGRVRELDWRRSYGSAGGYWIVERLRRQAATGFDVVLVDAPAGRSGIGPAPLLQMSDLVIMVMTANEPALAGTADLADELAMHPARAGWARRPLKFLFAHSRAVGTDRRFLEWMRGPVATTFETLRRKGVLDPILQGDDPARLLLEDDPSARVGQFSLDASPRRYGSPLAASYARLASIVAELAQGPRSGATARTAGGVGYPRRPSRRLPPDAPPTADLFGVLHRELADAQAAGDRARVGRVLGLLAEVEHVAGDDAAALVYAEQGVRMSPDPGSQDMHAALRLLRERILGEAEAEADVARHGRHATRVDEG